MGKPVYLHLIGKGTILQPRKINEASFSEFIKASPEVLEVDIVIGSDLIFNTNGLRDFSNFLKVFKGAFEKLGKEVPFIYMAHKARHDAVDQQIPEEIENCGYFGEQVDEVEMDPDYTDKRIDIFVIDCCSGKY